MHYAYNAISAKSGGAGGKVLGCFGDGMIMKSIRDDTKNTMGLKMTVPGSLE